MANQNANEFITSSVIGAAALAKFITATASFTAVSGNRIAANTGGGSFTITLPANPVDGAEVHIVDHGGSFATNPLTVDRNGETIAGIAENLICTNASVDFYMVFKISSNTWEVFGTIASGIGSIEADTDPKFGGNLDVNGFNITGLGVLKNDNDNDVITIPSGTVDVGFAGDVSLGRDLTFDSDGNTFSQIIMAGTNPTSTNTRRAMVCNDGAWVLERYDAAGAFQGNDFVVDAAGKATFSGTVQKNGTHPAFLATVDATIPDITGNNSVYQIIFGNDSIDGAGDQGGNYNNTTGVFTAPIDGFYFFETNADIRGMTAAAAGLTIAISTSMTLARVASRRIVDPAGGEDMAGGSVGTFMDANDTTFITIQIGGEAGNTIDLAGSTNFSGTRFSGTLLG